VISIITSSSHLTMDNDDTATVKFLIHYQQQATVIYLPYNLTLETFYKNLCLVCHLTLTNPPTFTVKWLDEALDAITMSSQRELNTAIRLYKKKMVIKNYIYMFFQLVLNNLDYYVQVKIHLYIDVVHVVGKNFI